MNGLLSHRRSNGQSGRFCLCKYFLVTRDNDWIWANLSKSLEILLCFPPTCTRWLKPFSHLQCLPRNISRELDWKQNSQDSNLCPYEMLVLQTASHPCDHSTDPQRKDSNMTHDVTSHFSLPYNSFSLWHKWVGNWGWRSSGSLNSSQIRLQSSLSLNGS